MFDKFEEVIKIIDHLKDEQVKDTRNIQKVYEFICEKHAEMIIQTRECNNRILAIIIHLNTSLTSCKWKEHLHASLILLNQK